jgi:hypothetical protein
VVVVLVVVVLLVVVEERVFAPLAMEGSTVAEDDMGALAAPLGARMVCGTGWLACSTLVTVNVLAVLTLLVLIEGRVLEVLLVLECVFVSPRRALTPMERDGAGETAFVGAEAVPDCAADVVVLPASEPGAACVREAEGQLCATAVRSVEAVPPVCWTDGCTLDTVWCASATAALAGVETVLPLPPFGCCSACRVCECDALEWAD